MYERQLLKELEALKNDANNANQKVINQPNSLPRPSIIPPLEDDMRPPVRSVTSAPPIPRSASNVPTSASTSALPPPKQQLSTSSSVPGPSTQSMSPPPPGSAPPPGSRFRDGTQSMLVQPTNPSAGPLSTGSPSLSFSQDPLLGKSISTPASPSRPLSGSSSTRLDSPHRPSTRQQVFDPLANLTAANMSQSMRVQPSRPRLDAKIAASKLANMF